MYRLIFSHPITLKQCSRSFKSLKSLYGFIRAFSCSICFEVIPLGTSEEFYIYYDLFKDRFIMNSGESQKIFDLSEVK